MLDQDIKFASAHLDASAVAEIVQISNFDEISEILRSRKFVQGAFQESRKTIMADTVLVIDGKRHLLRRNVLSQIFNDNRVADMREQYLVPVVEHTLAEILGGFRKSGAKGSADLVELAQRCVYRIAAAVAGIDGIERPEVADRMIEQVKAIAAGFTVEWSRDEMSEVLLRAKAAQEAFRDEFFKPSFDRRMKLAADHADGNPADLPMDVLMKTILHCADAWAGDDNLALREISVFMVAASQTTTHGFVSFILRLENWMRAHPEDRHLIDDDPNFLRGAAFESLRLTVAAPARIREATEDVTLASGRQIKSGERVALLFVPANMEPERFGDDSTRFNPHRPADGMAPWGLAFGAGAHSCPGRPLITGNRSMKAKTEIDGSMVTIARRLYAAGLELDPANPPVPDETTHYDIYKSVPVLFSLAKA